MEMAWVEHCMSEVQHIMQLLLINRATTTVSLNSIVLTFAHNSFLNLIVELESQTPID